MPVGKELASATTGFRSCIEQIATSAKKMPVGLPYQAYLLPTECN